MFDCLSQSICQHTKTRQIFNGVTRSAAELLVVQVLWKTPLSTIKAFEAFGNKNKQVADGLQRYFWRGQKFAFWLRLCLTAYLNRFVNIQRWDKFSMVLQGLQLNSLWSKFCEKHLYQPSEASNLITAGKTASEPPTPFPSPRAC